MSEFKIYKENDPGSYWLASSRRRAELTAFLVGLRSMWPNPLNAQRVVIESPWLLLDGQPGKP